MDRADMEAAVMTSIFGRSPRVRLRRITGAVILLAGALGLILQSPWLLI